MPTLNFDSHLIGELEQSEQHYSVHFSRSFCKLPFGPKPLLFCYESDSRPIGEFIQVFSRGGLGLIPRVYTGLGFKLEAQFHWPWLPPFSPPFWWKQAVTHMHTVPRSATFKREDIVSFRLYFLLDLSQTLAFLLLTLLYNPLQTRERWNPGAWIKGKQEHFFYQAIQTFQFTLYIILYLVIHFG